MRRRTFLAAAALLALSAGCGGADAKQAEPGTVRLGYFANLTHAVPIAALDKGFYQGLTIRPRVFNAGPAAIEALFAGSIDATYIGSNPAINGFARSNGAALRIVAGATSGGASLVVRDPAIKGPNDLKGKTIATPSLGNTQDVALRAWLLDAGIEVDPQRGGDVKIAPTDNATTLQLFKDGKVDGAWAPEPWASRLVLEGGGHVLVDEKTLWPAGRFATTHLVVATKFLDEHPDVVKKLLEGHAATVAWINASSAEAKAVVNAGIDELTGKKLAAGVIDRAWPNLTITNDPVAGSLAKSAKDAEETGLTKKVDLAGIYDLRLLNEVLKARNEAVVDTAGLGKA